MSGLDCDVPIVPVEEWMRRDMTIEHDMVLLSGGYEGLLSRMRTIVFAIVSVTIVSARQCAENSGPRLSQPASPLASGTECLIPDLEMWIRYSPRLL